MIATHRVTTSGMSRLSAARDVMTVPANSAKGTAYCNTIRFRVEASFDPKSCRHAATKPSRKVTTIGRSALKIVSSMVVCPVVLNFSNQVHSLGRRRELTLELGVGQGDQCFGALRR